MANSSIQIERKFNRFLFGAALILFAFFVSTSFSQAATVTPRLELNGDPGQTLRGAFKIHNEERQSKTFYVSFENFQSVDETGNPTFSGGKEDLATWITAPESVTVGPLDFKEVPMAVQIPLNAEPGGHFAAIFLTTEPPSAKEQGEIALSSKLGTLILLPVNGE